MAQLKDSMAPFLTAEEIADMTRKLAREIESDYDGKEIVYICPRGCVRAVCVYCL